jgi:hypothetical protein
VRTVRTASFATGVVFILCCNIIDWYTHTFVSNVKINYVMHILNPLKLTAYIEIDYDVEVHIVVSDVLQR